MESLFDLIGWKEVYLSAKQCQLGVAGQPFELQRKAIWQHSVISIHAGNEWGISLLQAQN